MNTKKSKSNIHLFIKKHIFICFIMMIITLSGCQRNLSIDDSSYIDSDLPSTTNGLSMSILQESYPKGTEEITIWLENTSDQEVYYGKAFHIEKKTKDGWRTVPFDGEVAFIAIAIQLHVDGKNKEEINLSLLKRPLTVGMYRVVKDIGSVTLAAKFEIK